MILFQDSAFFPWTNWRVAAVTASLHDNRGEDDRQEQMGASIAPTRPSLISNLQSHHITVPHGAAQNSSLPGFING